VGAHSKALEIRLKVLGPEHPDVAMSYNNNNLGLVHSNQVGLHDPPTKINMLLIRFRRERVQFLHSCRADDKWKRKNPQYAQGGSMVLSCRARMCHGARVSARHSGK
jgi:hypothetical protein